MLTKGLEMLGDLAADVAIVAEGHKEGSQRQRSEDYDHQESHAFLPLVSILHFSHAGIWTWKAIGEELNSTSRATRVKTKKNR